MIRNRSLPISALAVALTAVPAFAQSQVALNSETSTATEAPADSSRAPKANPASTATVGLRNVDGTETRFEAPKQSTEFLGMRIEIGGAFMVGAQALDHSNSAAPKMSADGKTNVNELAAIRGGFNLPTANLNLGVQLAKGIRMDLESYMSSRHHNEFWVKGGYATIDASPFDVPALNKIMEYVTIRAGMYEPNYGDALFRRTDNGNALNNPFAENYIMDAFTTEPGMDAMVRVGDFFVMGGVTTGQNKGDIKENALEAKPAFVGKVGFDREFSEDLRVRLSGSTYTVSETPRTTLYGGDRAGSAYWGVLDNSAQASFTNGRINPGFDNQLTAIQINPFVKLGNLEVFGVIERATGKKASEATTRDVNQYAGDVVYRLFDDRLYVGGRYNVVKGDWSGQTGLSVDRTALALGWFLTPNLLTKVEYVTQNYDGFAATDIYNGGEFSGLVLQGAISF
jgi:hypothetical protein